MIVRKYKNTLEKIAYKLTNIISKIAQNEKAPRPSTLQQQQPPKTPFTMPWELDSKKIRDTVGRLAYGYGFTRTPQGPIFEYIRQPDGTAILNELKVIGPPDITHMSDQERAKLEFSGLLSVREQDPLLKYYRAYTDRIRTKYPELLDEQTLRGFYKRNISLAEIVAAAVLAHLNAGPDAAAKLIDKVYENRHTFSREDLDNFMKTHAAPPHPSDLLPHLVPEYYNFPNRGSTLPPYPDFIDPNPPRQPPMRKPPPKPPPDPLDRLT